VENAMPEKAVVIYSEQPFEDIWLQILRFTYDSNLLQHRVPSDGSQLGEDARNEVAASIQHGHEYFRAALTASLHTSPVQLYYGMVTLMKATRILSSGSCGEIGHHGMTIPAVPTGGRLGQIQLRVDGRAAGGLAEYAKVLLPPPTLEGGRQWSLSELLGSVPDLFEEYAAAYSPVEDFYCVPIERVVLSSRQVVDRIDQTHVPDFANLMPRIDGFKNRYLTPQETQNGIIVLRRTLKATDDLAHTALSGGRFLLVGHKKGAHNVTLAPLIATFMAMFILGTLSRYHARKWSLFVKQLHDAERHLIEMFIRLSVRVFPNAVLDIVTGRQHVFTAARRQDTDLRNYVETKDVKEMISREVPEIIRSQMGRSR
jgi:YaaC-like Protein